MADPEYEWNVIHKSQVPWLYNGKLILGSGVFPTVLVVAGCIIDPQFRIRPGILNVLVAILLGTFFGHLAGAGIIQQACLHARRRSSFKEVLFRNLFVSTPYSMIWNYHFAVCFLSAGLAVALLSLLLCLLPLSWPWLGHDQSAVNGTVAALLCSLSLSMAIRFYRWYMALPD